MRALIITLSLLSACSSGNQLGADMAGDLDAVRVVVEAHHDAASQLTSAGEFASLEATYDEDYGAAMMDMSDMMDMMMDCMSMHDGDESSMDDMHDHMDEMDAEHDAHGTAQGGCADMATCMEAEDAHYDAMMEHMDAMGEDGGSWDEEMSCEDMGDEGMGM